MSLLRSAGSSSCYRAFFLLLLRINSEAIPTRQKIPTENMFQFGQASSHSVLGMVGRRLALKLQAQSLSARVVAKGATPMARFCTSLSFYVPSARLGLWFVIECL